jgi:hypothetical protein
MGQVQEWSKTFEAVFSFNTLNRYDLPSEHQHPVGNPRGPKNKITVYPNFFHAIKTLTTFEYKDFPKTIKTKKNRVQKIRALAHDLHQVLDSDLKPVVSNGRIEISMQREEFDCDIMRVCQAIAMDQFKVLSMKLVPISDILAELNTVIDHPDSVGSDATPLTPKDEAEVAILSNMVGLWSFKFKKYLDKRLEFLDVYNEDDFVPPPTLFESLSAEAQLEILTWFVGTHSRSITKFTFRTWNSKGGLRVKNRGPPIPNGSFDSPEEAAEAILKLAEELECEWDAIPMLVRSSKPIHRGVESG